MMKAAFYIGWRSAYYCALVLAVLLVPMAHSAHFHEGGNDGDASVNATCVLCHAARAHYAECAVSVGLTEVHCCESGVALEPTCSAPSVLLASRASRAPPASLTR